MLIIFFVSILPLLNSCLAFLGYNSYFIPSPGDGWQNVEYKGIGPEKFVEYKCQEASLNVNHAPLPGGILAVGIVVPIIPIPISDPIADHVEINLHIRGHFTGTTSMVPNKLSLYIKTNNNEFVYASKFRETHLMCYYEFPISIEETDSFYLIFAEPYTKCKIPPLEYLKKTYLGYGAVG